MKKLQNTSLRHYRFATFLTILIAISVFFKSGVSALWPIFLLAVIEVTFSFENAVLNSEVLSRMTKIWRTVFLTVGIFIAVFLVRLVLPLILVSASVGLGIGDVLDQALHHPDEYAHNLHEAYPMIAAFGGTFLLMIGLRFLAEDRKVRWLKKFEEPISNLKQPWLVPIAGAAIGCLIIALGLSPGNHKVEIAAILGAAAFLIIKGLSAFVEHSQGSHKKPKKHGNLINFLYLEMLDASFSFDGVIAAFAITKDVILIAAGLGIGAVYVRSITVHLLESGTLTEYRYLIHGAHYAITVLGMIMLISIKFHVPEAVTGLISLVLIGWSLQASRLMNKREAAGTKGYL